MNSHKSQAELHRALAHPVRLRILEILAREEACVCHLTAVLRKPQPYVSQQLSMLKEANLVADRREGTLVYYRLQNDRMAKLLDVARELIPEAGSREVPSSPVPGCPCSRCQLMERQPENAPSVASSAGCAEGAS